MARLVFLAFIGLTGFIIYNSLYLQEQRSAALLPRVAANGAPATSSPVASAPADAAPAAPAPVKLPAVSTDLPALQGQEAPTQLVTAIQRELAAQGYGSGPADGKLTYTTRKAITDFQKDHGLPLTGSPTDELLRHILLGDADAAAASTGAVASAATAGEGAKPSAPATEDPTVKGVQQILADLGYAPGPVDGSMGTETERAVSAFQRDRKIAANGQITPELLREIKRVTGRELAREASTR